MKKLLLATLLLAPFIACDKDDDPVSPYPKSYTLANVDQTDEGLYLVNSGGSLTDLPNNIGLYGAYKDSLKTEIQKEILSTLNLVEIELTSDSFLAFHYIYQGHPVLTPTKYSVVNGEIIIPDTLFAGLVSHDKAADRFILCGATPFALPGPNAFFPFGPPYLEFNTIECVTGHVNRDYAQEFTDAKNLQPLDTVGVLLTKYIFTKE